MLEIKDKTEHDPVTDMHTPDATMRWALLAAEQVVGEKGLSVVLRDAGLERFIDNYPSENLTESSNITFGDYAALNASLLNFFGRAGKSMVLRAGRISSQQGLEHYGPSFKIVDALATTAVKVLPIAAQLKLGLQVQQKVFREMYQSLGQKVIMRIEDRGKKLANINETCMVCAGKQSNQPMCWLGGGLLQESIHWLTGKEFEIIETECRAMGAPACVWEISKTPKAG
ncbi:MAG: 4-vinyl reductase [Chloroflexi bacterium]|nr:4-vinyl reductase [Chloroflexota bacterium]